jgi:hypothetical protein
MTRAPRSGFLVGCFVLLGLGAMAYLSLPVGGLAERTAGWLHGYATFDETGG